MKLFKYIIFVVFVILAFLVGQNRASLSSAQGVHDDHLHSEESHRDDKHIEKERLDEHCQGSTCLDTKEKTSHYGHDENAEDEHGEEAEEGIVELDEEAREMIQLKSEKVGMKELKAHIMVYGKIARDTEDYSTVTFNGDGMVETIYVSLGEIVEKGTPLLSIRKSDGAIERIVSKGHGTIFSIFVKSSERIDKMTSLLSYVNVDILKATIDVYEKDLRLVAVGQKALLTTAAYPEKEFSGKVVYISPQVDEHTQAIQVRVDVDNKDHLLRLGMFISGELFYSSDDTALAVPNSAIQQLGGEEVVFVQEEPGHYKRRDIVVGRMSEDFTEIKNGLAEGDIVVTQGSFYLKSEIAKGSFGDGHNH